jgi:DNA-binding transcriptional MerR regulator
MPYKEPVIEKIYFTIGEVARMFNVNTSLIRFWEQEFDIIKPKKNKKGNRLFTKEDIANFHIIHHLVKVKGMTLKGAQKKMSENKDDTLHNFEIVKTLQNIKEMLLEISGEMENPTEIIKNENQ